MTGFSLQPGQHIHFVGIGGVGLSAIARVLLERGFVVTGSDLRVNELTEALVADGARVYQGHDEQYAHGAHAIVRSSAVAADNPELRAARLAGVPVFRRVEFLPHLLEDRVNVAVAGTHGKTTTTGMIAHMLVQAGLEPGFIVGGVLPNLGTNAQAGAGPIFVIEADEYDDMFLGTAPKVAVITNVEHEHPDIFADRGQVVAAFARFVMLLPPDGLLVVCADDLGARALGNAWRAAGRHVLFYGLDDKRADWRATGLWYNESGGVDFVVQGRGRALGAVRLRIPGKHNVLNALAALAVTDYFGLLFDEAETALVKFEGMARRFEVRGEISGVTVIDDYAHHPTAVRATLEAARARYPDKTLWAVWQPHTYSRTRAFAEGFAASFDQADRVIITDIYGAREHDPQDITAWDVVQLMSDHPWARHVGGDFAAVVNELINNMSGYDVVVVMSAGDGVEISHLLLERLEERIRETDEYNPFLATEHEYDDWEDPWADAFDEEMLLIEEYGDVPKEAIKELRRLSREHKMPITRELIDRVMRRFRSAE
ncbi:MAG: UDP-N-acetylmuramate--L-alanine ligase [Anaerolineae bacterium]|nr:UDP-N-acetylmuramate--L-alanine ligase [Anaerolineae bacterium]